MKTLLSLLIMLYPFYSMGQEDERIAALQSAMSQGDLNTSRVLFEEQTETLLGQEDYFTLSFYIPFAGRLATMADPNQQGLDEVEKWLEMILKYGHELKSHRQALLETATYYNDMGLHQKAYAANEKALHITLQIEGHRPSQWATIESNLGLIAQNMGNLDLAKTHHLKALEGYKDDSTSTAENYFFSNNHMGAISWYASKFDSAEYYFSLCLDNLEDMDPDPVNQYYRKSMIQNNLAGVNDMNGNSQESIRMVKSSIVNMQYFMDNALDDPRRNRAMALMTRSTQNLAGVYKSLGDYRQALGLLEYNLRQREKHFPAFHPEIIESWVVLGQLHHAMRNNGEAINYLERALEALQEKEEDYLLKEADAFYTLALIYESKSNPDRAREYYLLASNKLEMAMNDTFDYVYLEFLGHAATFFSKHGDPNQAFLLAQKGLDYISSVEGRNSIPGFGQILNMGQVHYNLGNYEKSGVYAREGKAVLEGKMLEAQSAVDSIRISFDLPKAILLEAESNFQLQTEKSEGFLITTLKSLKGAMTILEKRKTILSDTEDINLLFAQYKALLEFTKKVLLALFELTGEEDYLNQLIQIQETGVYNKIRAQLSKADQLQFAGVPQSIQVEEETIKGELAEWFENGGELGTYLTLTARWDQLLGNIKKSHPAYYHTRYASLGTENVELPQDAQIVRYFFIHENLYALVMAYGNQKLYPLSFDPALVEKVAENWNDPSNLGQVVHQLYQQIWAPFAEELEAERVVVIPDGPLFNLSFDLLTRKPINSFKEFYTESLLTKHAISYHYSLWLANSKNNASLEATYVAFAPGFDDHIKEKYLEWVTDSLHLDQAYLSLLPQPFTKELTEKASNLFGGEVYLDEASTTEAFKNNASNHKIVHIGTHAESNNTSPALSRLIFTKTSLEEDANLYAYEIYNINIQSNLTLLTACETGKPVYQPGEGMISLAHAFFYSGSESLLTSLWKIDEKASMEITDHLLGLLAEGMPKDRALKEAKLNYLSKAKGRTLSPQYWAGLSLIGDPRPIAGLHPSIGFRSWTLGGVLTLILFAGFTLLYFRFRKISERI